MVSGISPSWKRTQSLVAALKQPSRFPSASNTHPPLYIVDSVNWSLNSRLNVLLCMWQSFTAYIEAFSSSTRTPPLTTTTINKTRANHILIFTHVWFFSGKDSTVLFRCIRQNKTSVHKNASFVRLPLMIDVTIFHSSVSQPLGYITMYIYIWHTMKPASLRFRTLKPSSIRNSTTNSGSTMHWRLLSLSTMWM